MNVSPGSPLLVNLGRPPLLAAIREGTVRDKVTALKKKGIGPAGWTPHWFRHSHASALLSPGTPEWVVSRRLGHAHVQTTIDLYGWVREDRGAAGRGQLEVVRILVAGARWPVSARTCIWPVTRSPVWRLWSQLPGPWRGPVIGKASRRRLGVDHRERRLQDQPDGTARGDPGRAGVDGALAGRGRHPLVGTGHQPARQHPAHRDREDRPFPPSIRQMDWEAAAALQAWFYASRWRRFPPHGVRARLRVIFRFAHRADRGLPRRALVGAGLLASPLRPADSAVGTRTAGALRMLTRADHPSVAPGGGR